MTIHFQKFYHPTSHTDFEVKQAETLAVKVDLKKFYSSLKRIYRIKESLITEIKIRLSLVGLTKVMQVVLCS